MTRLKRMTCHDIYDMSLLCPEYAPMLGKMHETDFGHAAALVHDDTLLAIGAVQVIYGVGQVWIIVSPQGKRKPLILSRWCQKFLTQTRSVLPFHRLEARVHAQDYKARKFCKFFGFFCEGLNAHFYENGDDAYMYAWIAPEKD